uniref:RNA polymerase II-associated protein 3 n=1 Tax=Setaria digitata TaxID=48799 RepID=A0A915PM00_9BILA
MVEIESSTTAVAAERYRAEGNEHFRSGRYHNAIKSYTKSLECHETSLVLANRAQAYLNTKQYERALMDSAKALELDGKNVKAIFRYTKALRNLNLYEIAAEKIEKIDSINPKNKEVVELKESVQGKKNCVELRLSCGDRDEFLRSKVPLIEITNVAIVNVEIAEQGVTENISSTVINVHFAEQESSSLQIPPPPTTSFSFISDFQKLKEKPVAFAEYFLALHTTSYKELLDEVIETEMIKCLLDGFDTLANQSNVSQLLECLVKLADVSRFDIAMMFLDEASKNGTLL